MDDESIEIEFRIDEPKPKNRVKSRSAAPVEKFTFVMDGGKQAEPVKQDKTFSFTNYAEEFDEHINQSIRGYSNLRDDIVSISRYFIEDDTNVIT